ncbi:MAG: c-type cytochrome [Caulobacteraceae bacterium]|nr:c-type cytochrome [Caulobacteraceae bacterium]
MRAREAATLALAALAACGLSACQRHGTGGRPARAPVTVVCPGDNGGLSLSPGFCATVYADDLGHARHLAVAPDGTVYVNTWSGAYYPDRPAPAGGLLVALRDSDGDGRADVVQRFGPSVGEGGAGGTGIAVYAGAVYAEDRGRILRYRLTPGSLAPTGPAEVVVAGLPLTGDHPMHPFGIDARGQLFVDVASATNACQRDNRIPGSPGRNPCGEKRIRAGIWRYDANRTGQVFSSAGRYASGLRNAEGFAFDAAGRFFATQHGRDQLAQNWPSLYTPGQSAELPAEELVQVARGADYGWPECYYDQQQAKLVLAPEYGGDGGRKVGICAGRRGPVAAFPGHWAPNDLLIYRGAKLPQGYRGGAFIAFHGSWNRAPLPQGGYNVVFQPLENGKASGPFVVFADGFAGPDRDPGGAAFRPTGLAEGPDGAIYVADDVRGRIWRITYQGDGSDPVAPAPAAPVGPPAALSAEPPEGTRAEAGEALPTPPGATAEEVRLGQRIFEGAARGGTCSGCHGPGGTGGPQGPALDTGRWLWGDGSLRSIRATIEKGVPHPKRRREPMPPQGGAQLTDKDVDAVAAYVWAIGHAKPAP